MGSIDNKSSLVHVMVWHRNRRQAITWTNSDLIFSNIYALPSLNMSMFMISMYLDVSFVIEFEIAMHTNWHFLVSKHPQAYQCPLPRMYIVSYIAA